MESDCNYAYPMDNDTPLKRRDCKTDLGDSRNGKADSRCGLYGESVNMFLSLFFLGSMTPVCHK